MAMLRCMNCMEEYNEKYNKCSHCGYVKVQSVKEERYLLQETTLQRRYIVGNVLRENEQEIIYIGWDQVLEKRIAIKEYFPVNCVQRVAGQKELLCKSEEEKAQFVRGLEQFTSEAQQLARFREETGIIRIYDSFEENGTAYTIIEYTENLRIPNVLEKTEVIRKWQHKKKMYYIGWGIGVIAISLLTGVLFLENDTESVSKNTGTIPDVVGMSYQQAEDALEQMGVRIEREKYCYNDSVETDIITCQNIPEGTKAWKDMVVKVVVTSVYEKATTEMVTTSSKVTERTTQSTAKVTQETTKESTKEKTTQQTTKESTKKKTTQKKTEKKKTENKTEQEEPTEKATTEEVIVIEE